MLDTAIFSSERLCREILPAWMPPRRWFGGKARSPRRFEVVAASPVVVPERQFLAVRVGYSDGAPELYSVPLGIAETGAVSEEAVLLEEDGKVLHDAVAHPQFRADLLDLMRSNSSSEALKGCGSELLAGLWLQYGLDSRMLGVEQSNTSVIYGDQLFLKLFRRLQPGENPDAEITRYLSERQSFPNVPPFGGALDFMLDGCAHPAGLLLGCVENQGDAWAWALRGLADYYASNGTDQTMPPRIRQLGVRTAEMHLALAGETEDPAFRPEPLTAEDLAGMSRSIEARFDAVLRLSEQRTEFGDYARMLRANAEETRTKIKALANLPEGGLKTRHHGDYNLGQVLATDSDWTIIDFEGEPSRPLVERRAKRSPLRDVAGMLRSLHYAARAACPDENPETRELETNWAAASCSAFLEGYFSVARGAAYLPRDHRALLNAYVLEKALYEIDYELNNRPAWLSIPLDGLTDALAGI